MSIAFAGTAAFVSSDAACEIIEVVDVSASASHRFPAINKANIADMLVRKIIGAPTSASARHRLLQIGDHVLGALDADRESDHFGACSPLDSVLIGKLAVRGG